MEWATAHYVDRSFRAIARFARWTLLLLLPGVSLRSTPGSMLTPATRVLAKDMKRTKQKATDAISSLPVDATWEDINYCLYVRKKIEEGIKARMKSGTFPRRS